MLLVPISADQCDARSPVDDILVDSIRQDLEDLDDRIASNNTFDYEFKVNGVLSDIPGGSILRVDGALVSQNAVLSRARIYLEKAGTSGTLGIDIRKYTTPNSPITSITRQFSDNIQSITQIAPALATQSISKATPQISTQSISRWKSTINISSIILLGSGLVRINLASAMSSDWLVGDSITVASATSGANNGQFTIVRVNDDATNNLVITNASGVAQTSAAGNVGLDAWAYNFTNPVSTQFVANGLEVIIAASHSTAGNNGNLTIYAVNSGGNNIVVKNASGAAQAGVAGTVDSDRWSYNYGSAVSSDFVVGEHIYLGSHTNANNDGYKFIRGVNVSGNNLIIQNISGVAQAGVAGVANTARWIYSLSADPSSAFSVGQRFVASGTTSANNSGTFVVVEVKRSSLNNLVIADTSATGTNVAQGGAVGTLVHTRMLISFASDLSANYTVNDSKVELYGVVSPFNSNGQYTVLENNRGGGSNYNVVVDNATGVVQSSPAGRIILESKSIFVTAPTLTLATITYNATERDMQFSTITSGFSSYATIASGDMLAMSVTQIPNGSPENLVVQVG